MSCVRTVSIMRKISVSRVCRALFTLACLGSAWTHPEYMNFAKFLTLRFSKCHFTPATRFVRFQTGFMINIVIVGEYTWAILFLWICKIIKNVDFFLNTGPYGTKIIALLDQKVYVFWQKFMTCYPINNSEGLFLGLPIIDPILKKKIELEIIAWGSAGNLQIWKSTIDPVLKTKYGSWKL